MKQLLKRPEQALAWAVHSVLKPEKKCNFGNCATIVQLHPIEMVLYFWYDKFENDKFENDKFTLQ